MPSPLRLSVFVETCWSFRVPFIVGYGVGALQYSPRSPLSVNELTIQPTAKFIKAGFVAVAVAVLALDTAFLLLVPHAAAYYWVLAIPFLLFLWPGIRALRRRLTRTVV